jgi:hypothetical protein
MHKIGEAICEPALPSRFLCDRTALFIVAVASTHQGRCKFSQRTLDPATSDGRLLAHTVRICSRQVAFSNLSFQSSNAYAKRHAVADCPQGQFCDPAPPRNRRLGGKRRLNRRSRWSALAIRADQMSMRAVSTSTKPAPRAAGLLVF